MDMPEAVVHALSVHRKDDGSALIRATIRLGEIDPGMTLYYRDVAGLEHKVTLRERRDHRRHVELLVEGEEIDSLVNGRFLYTRPEADNA